MEGAVGVFERIKRAETQSREMAEQLGVDLHHSPEITPGLEAANMRRRIFRCAWCAYHDDCEKRLEGGGLTEAPEYCRNKAEFDWAARISAL